MFHPIFEQLENAGLVRDRRVISRKVGSLSLSRLVEISEQAAELTSAEQETPAKDIYSHAASLSLGGGTSPCTSVGCRRKRLDELARFTALYSDKVYIHNFLADHAHHVDTSSTLDAAAVRRQFAEDLQLLVHVRPLVDAGRLIPLAMPAGNCPHCTLQDSYGANAAVRSQEVAVSLAARYLDQVTVTLKALGRGSYDLDWTGPEDLLEHGGGGRILSSIPEELSLDQTALDALGRGQKIVLTREQCESLSEHHIFAGTVLRSVAFEMSVSQALKASYVTDRVLEIDVLNTLSGDAELTDRNRLVEKHLTALVPFAADVPVARLLELRAREEEAFLLFRQALNRAITEYKNQGRAFHEVDARTLYGDVIAPTLASLDQRIRSAKKGIAAEVGRDMAAWGAAISFGLYAGWVPAGIAAAATTLGFTKIGADVVKGALKARDVDSNIRNEEYYFLWKVQGAAKPRPHRSNTQLFL